MICAGNPGGVEPAHAVIARERIHDRLVERMAHMQRACHVRGRQLNREILKFRSSFRAWQPRAPRAGDAVAALLPFRPPLRFDGVGLKRFGEGF